MSVEEYSDEQSQPQTGNDFMTDLKTVGRVTAEALRALDQAHETDDQFHQATRQSFEELVEWIKNAEMSRREAIVAAWFFILSHRNQN